MFSILLPLEQHGRIYLIYKAESKKVNIVRKIV